MVPPLIRYLYLYLPYLAAVLLSADPVLSYLVAWSGSFIILFLTISGKIKPLPKDLPLTGQVLRPIVFTQLIFAGYTCLSSIFYFMALNGYYYFAHNAYNLVSPDELALVAIAQRGYLLGHAAVTTGMLLAMDYSSSGSWRFSFRTEGSKLLLVVAAGSLLLAVAAAYVPGMYQLYGRFKTIALVASVLSFAVAIPERRAGGLKLLNLVVFLLNLGLAILSGWKEEVIAVLMLLAAFAYPFYKRTVTLFAPAVLLLSLLLLPTFSNVFRQSNWYGDEMAMDAALMAIDEIQSGSFDLKQNNWEFLTVRLSEISHFTKYMRHTPGENPFYGMRILEQAIVGLIPRILWTDKPDLERLVMERAYENDVVSRSSIVSAKPQFVVDGYLSRGEAGIFLSCLWYGFLASLASRLAERWFGGYLLGTGLVYTALFQIMWRGNSFEFFLGTIFWSFAFMYGIFVVGRYLGWIIPAGASAVPVAAPSLAS